MRLDSQTMIWIVTDPGGSSAHLAGICTETTFDALPLQLAALSPDLRPAFFTTKSEAKAEAHRRLLVWRLAHHVRIDREVPEGEPVHVTVRAADGSVLFEGTVR